MREPPPGRHFIPDGLGYIVSCPATCLRSAAPGTRVRDANYGDPSPQSAQRSRRKLELLTNAPRPHDGCSVRVPGLIVGRETAPVIGSCTILPFPMLTRNTGPGNPIRRLCFRPHFSHCMV